MQLTYCVKENKPCNEWVEKYFQDCLCNIKDDFSFAFGLISLVCWGVAEIPQIITNFRTKSSHGVSLAFLLTWVAGDVFNLVGCLLEPATLPTQYYTALLYTVSTVVLVIQTVYYDHLRRLWKSKKNTASQKNEEDEHKKSLICKSQVNSSIPIPNPSPKVTPRREFYFMSARSLASSDTPPFRTYMRAAKSGPPALVIQSDYSSSDDEHQNDSDLPVRSTSPNATQPRPIPQQARYGTFLAASAVNLFRKSDALTQAYIRFTGRKLLHENAGESHTVYGQWLGWMMAAIYMGGRLPQIWLNIKRGSVEGLNPLMFIFALIANVTYVGSILVRSIEWGKIKANMPWLLDAIVCVALDLFIILQYIYYRYYYMDRQTRSNGEDCGDYVEQHKHLVS